MLDRYELIDAAIKVVGVGSVGTSCAIVLMMAGEKILSSCRSRRREPRSWRPMPGKASSRTTDSVSLTATGSCSRLAIFSSAGPRGRLGRHYYVRQLRDVKIKFAVETFETARMTVFAQCCGYSLALSHSRSGDAAMMSGYLGKSNEFDKAIAAFSIAYADQNEKDHAALKRAIRDERVEAVFEEAK